MVNPSATSEYVLVVMVKIVGFFFKRKNNDD